MNVRSIFNTLLSFGTDASVTACDRPVTPAAATPSVEQVIRENTKASIGQSIRLVGTALKHRSILVATDGTAATQQATGSLNRLRFKGALDNQGRMWAYAYTNRTLFEKTFPAGSEFAELSFPDFFGIIDRNEQFAGIFLNAGSDSDYAVPRPIFGMLKEALR